jgi:mannose-6-phosphate isomerase-like protein (cupin superfamily)
MEAVVDGRSYQLLAGDSLYFEGMVPHSFNNTGDGAAKLLCVMNAAFAPFISVQTEEDSAQDTAA